MILFGAVVGLVVGFLFVTGPEAVALAATVGSTILFVPLAPGFAAGLLVCVLVHLVVVLLLYILCALDTPVPTAGPPPPLLAVPGLLENFCRGALVGINASANFLLLQVVLSLLIFPVGGGLLFLLAVVVGVVNFLVAVPAVSSTRPFEAVLGWFSWLMPMSWLATGPGLLFFLLGAVGALFGMRFDVHVEWWTGTLVTHGGVVHAWWRPPSAFNMGNFSFVRPELGVAEPIAWGPAFLILATLRGVTFHEAGHTLNVAAFGGWYHYIGALHENVFPPAAGSGPAAYAELAAESAIRQAGAPWFPLWVPTVGLTGPGAVNAPATVSSTIAPSPTVVGTQIALDALPAAAPSVDPDSYPLGAVNPGGTPSLGFLWLLAPPSTGAGAAIADPNGATTSFVPDRGGDYLVTLAVTDGIEGTVVPQTVISVLGARANGPDSAALADLPLVLSAAGSEGGSLGALPPAPPGTPSLTLAWTVADSPAGSSPTLAGAATATPSFDTDAPGAYRVQLTVTTLSGLSHTDSADITVT